MSKKIVLVSALLVTTAGIANAGPFPYIGANLGINTITSTDTVNSNVAAARVVPVTLFAGYGGLITQNIYFAGELSGTPASAEITNKNNIKTTYGFGLSLLPGLMLNDHAMGFARAGFVRSRFSGMNMLCTGGIFGLGLQTSLTQHVDLRGEYDFTAYRTVGTLGAPRSDTFNLGLVYRF